MRLILVLILIMSCAFNNLSVAQKSTKKNTISGFVTDENQNPIPGARILIDNKNTNSITDNKGYYKIKVRLDSKLISIFTVLNGLSENPINGRTTIDFIIKVPRKSQNAVKTNKENDEKVNVGQGTQNKKDLLTPVGKVDIEGRENTSYQSIYDMIRRVPGVIVSDKNITIQGATSSYGFSSQPLFVVDGTVVNSIDNISPQTVKSIEILKGPSASIYGSRGANGVILITLKGTR
ncbi:MAG TPA: TonB-dependent receptor plug domain-containing protein [Bacteroidales bacterium]|nr:TonB-dependent receptor plug domain-containing protein [Bacteroidales bacterium]